MRHMVLDPIFRLGTATWHKTGPAPAPTSNYKFVRLHNWGTEVRHMLETHERNLLLSIIRLRALSRSTWSCGWIPHSRNYVGNFPMTDTSLPICTRGIRHSPGCYSLRAHSGLYSDTCRGTIEISTAQLCVRQADLHQTAQHANIER